MVYLARLVCLMKCLALAKIIAVYISLTHSVVVSVGNWQDGATAVCVWILGQMVSIRSLGKKIVLITVPHFSALGQGIFFLSFLKNIWDMSYGIIFNLK